MAKNKKGTVVNRYNENQKNLFNNERIGIRPVDGIKPATWKPSDYTAPSYQERQKMQQAYETLFSTPKTDQSVIKRTTRQRELESVFGGQEFEDYNRINENNAIVNNALESQKVAREAKAKTDAELKAKFADARDRRKPSQPAAEELTDKRLNQILARDESGYSKLSADDVWNEAHTEKLERNFSKWDRRDAEKQYRKEVLASGPSSPAYQQYQQSVGEAKYDINTRKEYYNSSRKGMDSFNDRLEKIGKRTPSSDSEFLKSHKPFANKIPTESGIRSKAAKETTEQLTNTTGKIVGKNADDVAKKVSKFGKVGRIAAGLGVGAVVISNMNKNKGQQTNGQLYGQQTPYGY